MRFNAKMKHAFTKGPFGKYRLVLFALASLVLFNSCQEEKEASVITSNEDVVPEAILPVWAETAVFYTLELEVLGSTSLYSAKDNVVGWSDLGIDAICLAPSYMIPSDSVSSLISFISLAHSEGLRVILDISGESKKDAYVEPSKNPCLQGLIENGFYVDGIVSSEEIDESILSAVLTEDGICLASNAAMEDNRGRFHGFIDREWSEVVKGEFISRNTNAKGSSGARIKKSKVALHCISVMAMRSNSERALSEADLIRANQAYAVFSFTYFGTPIIQYAQETRRFLTKGDAQISFAETPHSGFFKRMIDLRHNNQALVSGSEKANPIIINQDNQPGLIAYYKESGGESILVLLNLSNESRAMTLDTKDIIGYYEELFTGDELDLEAEYTETLNPWAYRVYEIRH